MVKNINQFEAFKGKELPRSAESGDGTDSISLKTVYLQ